MSRVLERDSDDYIVSILLPSCVPPTEDTLFKLNTNELIFDEDFWFDQGSNGLYHLCFPEEVVNDSDVITATDLSCSRKTLWSWSEIKGDIILDGKLFVATNFVSAPKPVEDDRCQSCGAMGNVVRTACICPKCGMVVWGC